MTEKRRRTVALTDSADDLLQRVGDRSGYISALVEHRWRLWTEAHRELRLAGWRPAEILAACDALNGVWVVADMGAGPGDVALELSDPRHVDTVCVKHGVTTKRWAGRVTSVEMSATDARALLAVVQEYWLGNEALAEAIRGAEK